MTLLHHNPADLFPPYRGHVHATEIVGGSRLLFISGLNGYERDGATGNEMEAGDRGGGGGMKKIPLEDERLVYAFIIVGASLPLQAFRAGPDPLSNTLFSIRGGHSAAIAYILGCAYGFLALFWLRRMSPPRPGLIFSAGMLLGLIPALFYACTAFLWTASPPIWGLTILGSIVGALEGTCAVWYFRDVSRSTS